jgi:hypothetical protein
MESPLPAILSGAVFVLGYPMVIYILSKSALQTTEFLAQAIQHATAEISPEPAPDPDRLKSDRTYLESLAMSVYNQSASQANIEQIAHDTPAVGVDMFRASPLPLVALTSSHTVAHVSQAFLSYTGLTEDAIVGRVFSDVCSLYFSSEDTLDSWLGFVDQKVISLSRSWERVKLQPAEGEPKQLT